MIGLHKHLFKVKHYRIQTLMQGHRMTQIFSVGEKLTLDVCILRPHLWGWLACILLFQVLSISLELNWAPNSSDARG